MLVLPVGSCDLARTVVPLRVVGICDLARTVLPLRVGCCDLTLTVRSLCAARVIALAAARVGDATRFTRWTVGLALCVCAVERVVLERGVLGRALLGRDCGLDL
ncbi:MAG: hypothetical protein GTN75_15515 [Gemmatimonadetes bacterium]|nr:hypothetical protein [Gemmatimonadota bacterium]